MINGSTLRDAIISGANNISNEKLRINSLNVFPVPDGDTGSNMSMTMLSAKQELLTLSDDTPADKVASVAASALLRGARGNSGVITSLLFRGFAKGIAGMAEISAENLKKALKLGAEAAYKAVMKPTEGTMLTVARVAAEKLVETTVDDAVKAFEFVVDYAKKALDDTPKQLPVLAKAGVVDSGGAGLLCIYEGMRKVFSEGQIVPEAEPARVGNTTLSVAQRVEDIEFIDDYSEEDITFGYCTEFIVVKDNSVADALALRTTLETLGDSVVAVDDDEIIKCHLHTNDPGLALQEGLKYGALTKIKIDNMREELSNRQNSKPKHTGVHTAEKISSSQYSLVAVASGKGIVDLFLDSGVYAVVQGGQTMNPSTQELLKAIELCPSENVLMLPNNKNIIMAAEQAARISKKQVAVIPTKTIPQGLSAALAFDDTLDMEENVIAMKNASQDIRTGLITYAARSTNVDGKDIAEGELMGMIESKIVLTETDLSTCLIKLVQTMLKKGGINVTVITGADVSEDEAAKLSDALSAKLPNVELMFINGGQPVYYAIIWVE